MESDLNLLSTSVISDDKKVSKPELDTQIINKIGIAQEDPNKRKIKNKGRSSGAVKIKNRPYKRKALRAFKYSKSPIKTINRLRK